ncbi:hypothetical protein GIB67_029335 [Kingdonia uniflora]|uniref:AAA+ ATPase domain-containing protein n=1 Tax=Kingdonia uniflora TaxID=39325 RepID=A0A7J7N8N3_9MAGN|nr:hypothetical protein GIB67_029335 [Kingdonia uniflora]
MSKAPVVKSCMWKLPNINEIKMCSDGLALGNSGTSGIGVVYRDWEGRVMGTFCKSVGITINYLAEVNVEKYRPKQVKDVAHQEEVVKVLTNTLETSYCPDMLFYYPPGAGKTTTVLAIAHQLFDPELYKFRVLELNASDDRGINVVRTKIKDSVAVVIGTGGRQGGYPCPPYKIIILDEADSMTEDAQNALRRTMETYSRVTRFKPLSEEIMTSRVLHICNEEGPNLDPQALSTLSSISQGDLRQAITYLQGTARLFGSSISAKDLISVPRVIPPDVVQGFFAAYKSGDFELASKEVNNVIAKGYPVSQMIS